MSLSAFKVLPFSLQLGLLLSDGIPLLSRPAARDQRVLFSFHSFYVEAIWNQAGRLQQVRSFDHTSGLEPYLTQFDWHALA